MNLKNKGNFFVIADTKIEDKERQAHFMQVVVVQIACKILNAKASFGWVLFGEKNRPKKTDIGKF